MTPVMVAAVTGSRVRKLAYPLPWNATSTLDAATNAEYYYDYAGQDPINEYDLTGLLDPGQPQLDTAGESSDPGTGTGEPTPEGGGGPPEWIQKSVEGKGLPDEAGKGKEVRKGNGWRWSWGKNGENYLRIYERDGQKFVQVRYGGAGVVDHYSFSEWKNWSSWHAR